jgi:hypothetical protein
VGSTAIPGDVFAYYVCFLECFNQTIESAVNITDRHNSFDAREMPIIRLRK